MGKTLFYQKQYCKKPRPVVLPEDLILDDNFVVRLYDKTGKVISEYKMRNYLAFEDYKKDPKAAQKKLTDSTDASLIGLLTLPPKSQTEGLRYRVVRLDKEGNPSPYLEEGVKTYKDYIWEEELPPYSEYKTWSYNKWTGCYTYFEYRDLFPMWEQAPRYYSN